MTSGELKGMAQPRARSFRALTSVVAATLVGAGWQAQAEPARAVVRQTPPTTTGNLLQDLLNQLAPSTTVPAPPPAPAPGAGSPAGAPPPPSPAAPAPPPGPDGPGLAIAPDTRPRGPSRSNAPLLAALRQLEDLGFSESETIAIGMGRFPIAGEASYTDGFLEPRPGHLHQGVDITGALGTPVRAPGDGVVRYSEEGGYGKVASVTVADGTTYFMAHLDAFTKGLASGSAVKQGQIVGLLGSTGNSTGPHVHLEVRRAGGVVDPKPILDRWLDEALAAIPGILASFRGYETSLSRALTGIGFLRRYDARPPGPAGQRQALLSADPADPAAADAESWRQGRHVARAVMSPVTPPVLRPMLGGPGG